MAKVKIYELAKELGVESKEVIEFLGKKNIEVKSHSSAIEENEAQLVKQEFSKSEAAKEAPKKKNIVHVFRPQNTQNGGKQGRRQGGRPQAGARPAMQGKPMQVNNGRPAKKAAARPTETAPAEVKKEESVKQAAPVKQPAPAKQPASEKAEKPVREQRPAEKRPERSQDVKQERSDRGDRNGGRNERNDRGDRSGGRNDKEGSAFL